MSRGPKAQGVKFYCPGCGTPRPTVGSPCASDCLGAFFRLGSWSWTDLVLKPRPALVLDRTVYHASTDKAVLSYSWVVDATTPEREGYDAATVGAKAAVRSSQARVWRSVAAEALWQLRSAAEDFTADDVWAAMDVRCYRLFHDDAVTHIAGLVSPWDDFKDDVAAFQRPSRELGSTSGIGSMLKSLSKKGMLVMTGEKRSLSPASHGAMVKMWSGQDPTMLSIAS